MEDLILNTAERALHMSGQALAPGGGPPRVRTPALPVRRHVRVSTPYALPGIRMNGGIAGALKPLRNPLPGGWTPAPGRCSQVPRGFVLGTIITGFTGPPWRKGRNLDETTGQDTLPADFVQDGPAEAGRAWAAAGVQGLQTKLCSWGTISFAEHQVISGAA